MTQYIDENVFKSCITHGVEYPYFTINEPTNTVELKPQITDDFKKANPLNFLMINDTFHDLVNPRGTYNPQGFINGPLNYLMTNQYVLGDNVKKYTDGINFPEFQQLTGRFEPKVAKSFEINMGLQTADTFITYDNILNNVTTTSNPDTITFTDQVFLNKVLSANGSITISVDSGESSTFSAYIEQKNMGEQEKKAAYLKISYFIRWYLHSNLPEVNAPINQPFQIFTPTALAHADGTMKILFDAGSSFLKEFFSAEDSKVKPFVAIPCILDSASTSTEKLDPTLDFYFEQLVPRQVVPIVSNYFSCDKYFFCYLPNTDDDYNLDTLYGFSLAILKIDQPNHNEVERIGNIDSLQVAITKVREILPPNDHLAKANYTDALKYIYAYIVANQQIVARYFFGQVKKNQIDENSCGTCGAGVPYIGRVIDKIKNLVVQGSGAILPITNVAFQPVNERNPNVELAKIIFELNSLKNNATEPLNGRIPFSDARILKIFCDNLGNITIPEDHLYYLFQILADYKRTGDYQQAYTLLKAILTAGGDNREFFTFCSGDELSALIGRLLGVPTIYQTASGAQCRLYRGRLFSTNPEAQLEYELKNDINIIQKYCSSIRGKIDLLKKFIENNYEHNLQLREKLRTFITNLQEEFNSVSLPTLDEKKMNTFFKLISVRNAYNKLDKIVRLSELLLGNFFELRANADGAAHAADVKEIFSLCAEITSVKEAGNAAIFSNEEKIKEYLTKVSKFEETLNGLKIYNFIEDNFPQYFNNINSRPILIDIPNPVPVSFNGIKNLKIPLLGINLFSSKVRSVSSLFSTYSAIQTNQGQASRNPRTRAVLENKIRLQKIEFLNGYNEFIVSCKFLENSNDFKIEAFENFTPGFMDGKVIGLSTLEQQQAMPEEVSRAAIQGELLQRPTPDEEKVAQILANLSQALTDIGEPGQMQGQIQGQVQGQLGGKEETSLIQQGGAISEVELDKNIRTIVNDVKQLLLNLYNKCTNYIKNVQYDTEVKTKLGFQEGVQIPSDFILNVSNFIQFLIVISDTYETDQFCYQLLFQEADVEEENTIDNINIGFLTGLKLITNQYTYADFGYIQQRPVYDENSIVFKNISINFLLNNKFKAYSKKYDLSGIKTLLFLLGLSNYTPPPSPTDASPSSTDATVPTDATLDNDLLDLINTYFNETHQGEEVFIAIGTEQPKHQSLPLPENSPKNKLQINPRCIKQDNNKISGIFSIIVLSIMEVLYYGANNGKIFMFNEDYINNIIIKKGTQHSILQTPHYTYSFDYFTETGKNLFIFLQDTISKVGGSIGCPIETPLASGLRSNRGGKTIKKSKTRTNSKTRKMRKIRKPKFTKRIKKINNHKRSRK